MITVNEPTLDDLLYVGSWICPADREELSATRDPDDYESLARDAWDSTYKRVVLDDALPVMCFGAKPGPSPNLVILWGFKTARALPALRAATKHILRVMIPTLRASGVRSGMCLVHPHNIVSQRWLRHLGFDLRATLPDIGTGLLLFRRDEFDA